MKIKIGDKNKISNSVIGEQVNINTESKKENFFQKHPVITSIVTGLATGLILLFSFWADVIRFIEDLFK